MSDVENTAQTGAEVVPDDSADKAAQQAAGSEATTGQDEQGEQQESPEQARDEKGRFVPQERLNEVTKARRTAEREAAQLRAELQTLREQATQRGDSGAADDTPTLEQFGFDQQKWQEAVMAHAEKKVQAKLQQTEQQRSMQEKAQQFGIKAKEFAATTPDYVDRVSELDSVIQFSPQVIDVIADLGPAVAYHLATNLDEADRISRMPPHLAALQLGRIEAQISAPKPKPVTQAPKPVPTVRGGGVAQPDMEKMDIDSWMAARNAKR